MKKLFIVTIVCSVVGACAVQPARHAELPTAVAGVSPGTWSVGLPNPEIDAKTWWSQFDDPVLDQLIDLVLSENLDLQEANERVKQAQAITRQTRAALLPELDAVGHVSAARQNTPPPLGDVKQGGIGLALGWEPDVFGGERLALLADQAQLVGLEHAEDSVRLALAADTASAYVELRWAQSELKILQDNQVIRESALRLTQERLKFGLSTRLDVARAQNQLDALRARMAPAQAAIQHRLNLIAVYSGRTPESLDPLMLATQAPVPTPPRTAPQTLPSEALLRRPDVLAAYAQVEQRAAEVGAARAERYPKFSLRFEDGLLAASYLGMPTLLDNVFSAALSASSPIFNAGRITAGIEQSESKMRESELNLRQTMLRALREVEDARVDMVSGADSTQRLRNALTASDQSLRLAEKLYKGGATDFLDVLSAQEVYLRDSDGLNQAQRDYALAAVALYRSLGGGWSQATIGAPNAAARPSVRQQHVAIVDHARK